ncbi:MAG TPA: hypothetical protein VJ549_01440 [Geothrix sp.]|nr:hypothetical protein [Geothrix sp.]
MNAPSTTLQAAATTSSPVVRLLVGLVAIFAVLIISGEVGAP